MNDYDNRQLIGRGQRLPYVNDHDKEPVKQGGHRRQVHAETGVYDAGKETSRKKSEKQFQEFQSRTPSKKLL
jgi:hypothetical protein